MSDKNTYMLKVGVMSENLRPADVTEGELEWFRSVVADRAALREQVRALGAALEAAPRGGCNTVEYLRWYNGPRQAALKGGG